jgi:hypothetical protein
MSGFSCPAGSKTANGSNTCKTGYKAYDGDGVDNRQCLSPCLEGGVRNARDGACREPAWKQIMKVIGILTGIASFVAVAFKVHLFFKLRHCKRLAPGYTGLAGFFAVFSYGTKGDHTLEKDPRGKKKGKSKNSKAGKNQTSIGDMELSGDVKVNEGKSQGNGDQGDASNEANDASSVQVTVVNEGGRTASVDVDDAVRSTSNPFEGRTDSVVMNPACSVDKGRSTETEAAVSVGRLQTLESMDVPQLCAWLRDTVGVKEIVLEACTAEGIDGKTMGSIVRERDTEALIEIGMKSRLKTNKLFGAWA